MSQELSTHSDEELARETQAGSLVAFEELVYRYEGRVYAFINQFCRNPTDARELTQDAFVKAYQKLEQFDTRRSFAAWLFTIARRKCIDRHRSAPVVAEDMVVEELDVVDPAECSARREESDNLWRLARARLNENQFQALWLHYAEDMEVAQIAQVLGKTRVHIKVILFRARQVLGKELGTSSTSIQTIRTTRFQPALADYICQQPTRPQAK